MPFPSPEPLPCSLGCHAGYWADAVDPKTGQALHGAHGSRFSEPAWSHRLLGYPLVETGKGPALQPS